MVAIRVVAVLLLVAPAAWAQTTERSGAEPQVEHVGRGAQAQGADGSWQAVEAGDTVVIGAGLKGGAGTVLRWKDGGRDVGEVLAVESGGQVTIRGDRQVELVSGAFFAQVNAKLEVSATWGKVELAGDARVEVARGGQLKVLATDRICIVQTSGARQEVPAGQTATIETDGAVRLGSGRPPQVPAWLARLWRLDPRAIVYVQDFSKPLGQVTGTLTTGCLTGVKSGAWESLAAFFEWNTNLFPFDEGLVLRCQLRLSAPTPVTVMLNVKGQPNMFDTKALVRGGDVTEVDFDLAGFASHDSPPRRCAKGDLVWSVSVMSGTPQAPSPAQVEVRRLVVFRRPQSGEGR